MTDGSRILDSARTDVWQPNCDHESQPLDAESRRGDKLMRIFLSYEKKTIPVEITDQNFVGSLVAKVEDYKPGKSQQELVETSLDNPIGSRKLEEQVTGKKNIVIISSDHTRPVPSKIITPILLRRIRSSQPNANIKILVATGCHRTSTHQELVDKYGQEIVDHEQIVMHPQTIRH